MEFLAFHDALTELPNRTLLQDRMQLAMTRARRHQQTIALLWIDLDSFKQINDQHGHLAGDYCLSVIAQRLRHSLREMDTLARIGGDEFVAILENTDAASADAVAQKLLQATAKPLHYNNQVISSSLSIGIALFPTDSTEYAKLLCLADNAMYKAKAQGKNQHAFAEQL